MCGDTSVQVSALSKKITELQSIESSTGKSKFLMQFEVLETASPTDEEFDCSVAQLADNVAKNRTKQNLPREPCTCTPIIHVLVLLHVLM